MLKALLNGKKVYAGDCTDRQSKYRCIDPECNADIILKRGTIKIPHFAHKVVSNCRVGGGVGETHLFIQNNVYQHIRSDDKYINADVEVFYGDRRADIYFELPEVSPFLANKQYVIEIQRSNISPLEIEQRNRDYLRFGITVIWVIATDDLLNYKDLHSHSSLISMKIKAWYESIIRYQKCLITYSNVEDMFFIHSRSPASLSSMKRLHDVVNWIETINEKEKLYYEEKERIEKLKEKYDDRNRKRKNHSLA